MNMQFRTPLQVSPRGEWRDPSNSRPVGLQEEASKDMSDEELFSAAQQMQAAISSLLHSPDPAAKQEANLWLTASCGQPEFWTIALYLAFPPSHMPAIPPDVRFFALNILLNKIRTDSDQLSMEAATEIYETLVRQLPSISDPIVRSRLCIVIGAAAALSGPNICYEFVENMERDVEYPVAVELLTALAEEALLRSRALPREVLECLQDCCPKVMRLLERGLSRDQLQCMPAPVLAKSLLCLARWKNAGLTLSELHREHPSLHQVLLMALGSPHSAVYEASAGVLTELVLEVDILPGRDEAVRATIQGALSQRNVAHPDPTAMVELLAAIGTAEAGLLAQAQEQEVLLLQWLLQLTAGDSGPPRVSSVGSGGELGSGVVVLQGRGGEEGRDMGAASMAAEVWARMAKVPSSRRSPTLPSKELFSAALQALLRAAVLPSEDELDIDVDDFQRFREGPCSEGLQACFWELGVVFLDTISGAMQGAETWEALEVAVFAAGAVSTGIIQSAGLAGASSSESRGVGASGSGQKQAGGGGGEASREQGGVLAGGGGGSEQEKLKEGATMFMSQLFWRLPGAAALASKDESSMPNPVLVSTALRTAALYARFCVHSPAALEAGVVYSVGALRIHQARGQAAATLQALCVAAAPSLAAARVLAPLMQQCEEAAASAALEGGMAEEHRVAVVQGLASVAAMLPMEEAQGALAHLVGPAIASLHRLAPVQGKTAELQQQLSADLKVLTCMIEAVRAKLQTPPSGPHQPLPPSPSSPSPTPMPGTTATTPQAAAAAAASGGTGQAEALLMPLLQGAWPSVDAVAASWADDAVVGAALCSLWGVTARAVGSQLASVLPQVIAAAARMFESHRHAACLLCLADILGMPRMGARSSPQVEAALAAVPPIVAAALPGLEQASRGPGSMGMGRGRRRQHLEGESTGTAVGGGAAPGVGQTVEQRREQKEQHRRAADTLAAIWHLLLAYVAHDPQLLLSSPTFPQLCQVATACLSSEEPEVAQSAALFLADTVVGQPLEDLGPGQVPLPPPGSSAPAPASRAQIEHKPKWRLSPQLLAPVDAVCGAMGTAIVQEVLSSLVHGGSSSDVAGGLVDLLYALCVRHPKACQGAITALLQSPNSPLKCGELSLRHLDLFLAAATRQPPHTRQRFHDLMSDFSKVANRLMPAEAFEGY